MNTPDHYQSVMPYFVVKDAAAFIGFLTDVFGAKELLAVRNDDDSIKHAEYNINGGTIMIGQSSDQWPAYKLSNFILVKDVDDVYAKGLASGGAGNQEPSDQEYGRAAGFIDVWGNQWWLNNPEA